METISRLLPRLLVTISSKQTRWVVAFIFLYVSVLDTKIQGVSAAPMGVSPPPDERPICAYHWSDTVRNADSLSGGDELLPDGTVRCDAPTDFCFSFLEPDPSGGNGTEEPPAPVGVGEGEGEGSGADLAPGFTWLAGGCFNTGPATCHNSRCVATENLRHSFFCCCRGYRCNEDIVFKTVEEVEGEPAVVTAESVVEGPRMDTLSKVLYVILACLMVIMVTCVSVMGYKLRRSQKTLSNPNIGLKKSPTSPCIDLSNLKFLEMLGQGRYGIVYRAYLGEEEVAVKLFSHHHKFSFSNEKYIYSLPLMEHPNLLSYFGGGEMTGPDSNPYLGLVLSYCSRGRLSAFLQENTLDWPSFCKVVLSAVRGLAHLHSGERKGDLGKPCVCHRDFNTRNLLLREDMTCVVSDLGFAIHTQGTKFYQNGEEQIAEMASLTDVGTLRYMAPEVLEGAVNLRDCETSLKQIDIYALGLVLWEIAYRCHDLYQGTPTPAYALPFEAEIGRIRPSFEEMQVLVARNKARPLFPQIWKDTSPALKQLKETMKDCWDNDAEARLSAMCVEGRLIDLPKLWSRYKASLGMNSMSPTSSNPPAAGGGSSFLHSGSADVKTILISNELSLPSTKERERERERHQQSERESSVSENTVETTLPFSPSDPVGRILGKNELMEAVNVGPPVPCLQPHQGRNPVLERNTITDHAKEPRISGNDLLETSDKYLYSNLELGLNSASILEVLESQHGIDPQLMSEHLVPLLNSFIPPSPLPPASPPPNTPQAIPFPSPQVPSIPYLQNEMRTLEGRPKLQNREVEVKKGGWKRFWRSAFGGRLFPRHRGGRRGGGGEGEEEERGILVTPTSSTFSEPPTPLSPFHPSEQGCHQTQVFLSNGAPYTVISPNHAPLNVAPSAVQANPPTPPPSNLQRQQQPLPPSSFSPPSPIEQPPSLPLLPPPPPPAAAPPSSLRRPGIAETELGIARLQPPPPEQPEGGLPPPAKVRSNPGSKDSGINKSSENSNSFLDSDSSLDKGRRPTTLLLLQGGGKAPSSSLSATSDDDDLGSDGERGSLPRGARAGGGQRVRLRKAKQRVKTPGAKPAMPRFSLYDDSCMMAAGGGGHASLEEALSRSLPLGMNTLGGRRPRGNQLRLCAAQDSSGSLGRGSGELRLHHRKTGGGGSVSVSLSGGESASASESSVCKSEEDGGPHASLLAQQI